MKIVVDFNDLTQLIVADLNSKGISVDESNIVFTEDGVEISLDTVAKSKPIKKVKNAKPKQETKVETETVSDDTEEEFFDTQTEEVETQTELETEENDDDDSLFE